MRRTGWSKLLYIILGSLIGLLVMGFMILWAWSPGEIEAFYATSGEILQGSLSEIIRTEIGGMEQGMIVQSKNIKNPVLLFLHGGPGNPEYVLSKESGVSLEDFFTVCWWEQRGSGMSYSSSIEKDSITLEQMIFDTVEVTNYLRERFQQEKIYIMGHSWGSFLGIHTVAQYPELYHAYLGIGQVVHQLESEKLGYDVILEAAEKKGNKKYIERLKKHTITTPADLTNAYLMLRSQLMNDYGYGVFHSPKSKMELLLPIFKAREYTLKDKYGYAMGAILSLEQPMNRTQFTTNLNESIPELKIPVYFFHGKFDKQVSFDLALKYYESLHAPEKYFYSFNNSAHSPFLEEPEKFRQLIKDDVLGLQGTIEKFLID